MIPSVHEDRNAHIVAMRQAGMLHEEIGEVYAISRERVRQIIASAGHAPSRRRETKLDPIEVLRIARAPCVTSVQQVVRRLHCDRRAVLRLLSELGALDSVQRLYRMRRQGPQRARALAQLRAFSERYGRTPYSYELGTKSGTPKHPDLPWFATLQNLFGSMREGLLAAGLTLRKGGRPGHRDGDAA